MDNSNKIILDLAGGTGAWSEPYRKAGYTVYVITLPDYDVTKVNYYDDYMSFQYVGESLFISNIVIFYKDIHGILAAPVCTQFSRARTRAKKVRDLKEGMILVRACMDIIWKVQELAVDERGIPLLKFWAIENPLGSLRRFLGRPDFSFDPCDFGANYTKRTDLWGWFNKPTKRPILLNQKEKYLCATNKRKMPLISDITSSKQKTQRSITPPGFAEAFFRANK